MDVFRVVANFPVYQGAEAALCSLCSSVAGRKKEGRPERGDVLFWGFNYGLKDQVYFLLGDTLINPIPSMRFYIDDCSDILHQLIGKYPGPLFTDFYTILYIPGG